MRTEKRTKGEVTQNDGLHQAERREMIKYCCDRCGKEIEHEKRNLLQGYSDATLKIRLKSGERCMLLCDECVEDVAERLLKHHVRLKIPTGCGVCSWRDAEYDNSCGLNMRDYDTYEEQYRNCPIRKLIGEVR